MIKRSSSRPKRLSLIEKTKRWEKSLCKLSSCTLTSTIHMLILLHLPVVRSTRVPPSYHNHVMYPSYAVYHSHVQYRKANQLKGHKSFTLLLEPLTELLAKILNTNLVTQMKPRRSQIYSLEVTFSKCDACNIWIHLDTILMLLAVKAWAPSLSTSQRLRIFIKNLCPHTILLTIHIIILLFICHVSHFHLIVSIKSSFFPWSQYLWVSFLFQSFNHFSLTLSVNQ